MTAQRQLPLRQNSLIDKMRDSLTKFPSFMNVKRPTKFASIRPDDEMNVFASDMLSKEFILDTLSDIRHNAAVVKLEVEDLLITRDHHSFLPVVKALLSDDRHWQYVKFVDTIDASDILWWQGMKHFMMRDYEETIDDKTKYAGIVSIQANVRITAGSTHRSVYSLIKTIGNDLDLKHVNFGGALFGYSNETLPDTLARLFDCDGRLMEDVVIIVRCGWTSPGDHEACSCRVLKACQKALLSDHRNSLLEAKQARGSRRRFPVNQDDENEDARSTISARSTLSTSSASDSCSHSEGKQNTSRHTRSNHTPSVQGSRPRFPVNTPRQPRSNHTPSVQGSRRRFPESRGNEEVGSNSAHSTLSSHSSQSEGKRNTPRRTMSNHTPSVQVPRTRRTLSGPRHRELPVGRGVPLTSQSFNIKRTSSLKESTDKAPPVEAQQKGRAEIARRTKSFQHKRPTSAILCINEDRWEEGDKCDQPCDGNEGASLPCKPVRNVSSASLSSSRSKVRRTKSLDKDNLVRTERGNTEGENPDYDWIQGAFTETIVAPRAA